MKRLTNKAKEIVRVEDGINELLSLLTIAVYEKNKEKCDKLNIQIKEEIQKYKKLEGTNHGD